MNSKINLYITLFILSVTHGSMYGQIAGNSSERYRDAYKKYLKVTCPIPKDKIRHYVYFATDRELIINHAFLTHTRFEGAQIMYAWRTMEAQKGQYDFSIVKEDYEYLKKFGKNFLYNYRMPRSIRRTVPFQVIYLPKNSAAELQYNIMMKENRKARLQNGGTKK